MDLLLIAVFLLFAFKIDALTSIQIKSCVLAHNKLRGLHADTLPLEWDASLARAAQQYAEQLRDEHRRFSNVMLKHERPGRGMGENIYWSDNSKIATCAKASLSWYKEIFDYDYGTADTSTGQQVGHFTQMVWRKTQRFGLGVATMKSRRYGRYGNTETFIVAKYSPQGNFYMIGRKLQTYTENVRPLKPGARVPTLSQLVPTPKPSTQSSKCLNRFGDRTCGLLANRYSCHSNKRVGNYCLKACGRCR